MVSAVKEIKSNIIKMNYQVEEKTFLDLKFYALTSLDKTIDQLCNLLGEDLMDDVMKEDYCPYFGVPWEAGLGLTQFLSRQNLQNKKILELGSGLSLPSFISTKNGGKVLATDYHADVINFLTCNQKLNGIFFDFTQLNWRKEENTLGLFDIVLGSDVLYESAHPKDIAKSLIRYLAPEGKIILADPGRAYIQSFITAMQTYGYTEKLSIEKVHTAWASKEIFIFEFAYIGD